MMNDEQNHELNIRLVEQRVSSIEANMPTKSDFSVLSNKIDNQAKGFEAVENLATKIDTLITHNAKREEADKHNEKSIEHHDIRIKELEVQGVKFKEFIAADKPFKSYREWGVKILMSFIIGGILSTVFVITK